MSSLSRRSFVKLSTALPLAAGLGTTLFPSKILSREKLIWSNLIHLSFNMWEDRVAPKREMRYFRPFLRFDEKLWNELLEKMATVGMNQVVIDLGDGVRYKRNWIKCVPWDWNRFPN